MKDLKEMYLSKRSAFSLFELMIVIVIIGLVYAIVVSNFSTNRTVQISHLKDIKGALLPLWSKGKKVELFLYDNCTKGVVFINGKIKEKYKPKLLFSEFKDLVAYKDDAGGASREIEWKSFRLEDKVIKSCFDFVIYPNGSSSTYIVKQGEKYLIFFPYFRDVNISDDLGEALEIYKNSHFSKVTLEDAK